MNRGEQQGLIMLIEGDNDKQPQVAATGQVREGRFFKMDPVDQVGVLLPLILKTPLLRVYAGSVGININVRVSAVTTDRGCAYAVITALDIFKDKDRSIARQQSSVRPRRDILPGNLGAALPMLQSGAGDRKQQQAQRAKQ